MKLTENQQMTAVYEKFIGYQADPVGFYGDVLGMPKRYVWDKMREVAESVRDNQLTAVPAGHSVSKTYGAGRLAVWFKTCFQPSTVITTAPSDNQVRGQLWREIHAAYAGAVVPLGGRMTALQWDMKPGPDILASIKPASRVQWEKNFALGFSTSPDEMTEHATKMQGWHNDWVLIIIDEACGILPQIWRAILDGLVTNERVKVLAIGNATDPNSEFAQALKDTAWHVVKISCLDTPNYKEGREVIPGLAGREYVKRIKDRYGPQSNEFKIRVLGEMPTFKEGTYYGYEVAAAREKGQFAPDYSWDPTAKAYGFWDLGDMHTVGLFVQFRNSRIRLIDCYYDNHGRGLPEYASVLQVKPYSWNRHYAGPDLVGSNKKSVQTGMATRDIAAGLGIQIDPVIKHSFNDGIEAVRSIFPLLDVNTVLCQEAIDAWAGYGKKKNERLSTEDKPVYFNEPENTWRKHFADALRHLAVYFRYMTEEGFIGYATDDRKQEPGINWDKQESMPYDPLSHCRGGSYNPIGVY